MSLKSGPTKQFTNLPEFDTCQITTSKMLLPKTGKSEALTFKTDSVNRSEAFQDQSANVDIELKTSQGTSANQQRNSLSHYISI